MDLTPVTLAGNVVRLEPLSRQHTEGLLAAAEHDEIWTYLDEPTPHTVKDIERLVRDAESEYAAGQRLPFTMVEQASETIVGSISLIDIQPAHRGVEIGWAWLTPSRWGTGLAREAIFLLLRYAFDTMGVIRVAYKFDSRNTRSERTIIGIGGTREGVFRNHRILSDGYVRDSVYYSVIPDEWPAIRERFELGRAGLPPMGPDLTTWVTDRSQDVGNISG